jgi:TolB protein
MSSTHDDERFDTQLRAYLEWESGQLTDAPSRAEMTRRIAGSAGRASTSTWRVHAAPVPLLLAVALLLAAMVGLVLGRLLFDPLPQQRIVFARTTADGMEIAVMNQDGTGIRTLAAQPAAGEARNPRWSPDGSRVSWTADDGIHVVDADGSDARLLVRGGKRYDWSPDSQQIVVGDTRYSTKSGDLRLVDVTTGGVVRVIEVAAGPRGGAWAPAWSPDGSRIAFVRTLGAEHVAVSIVRADGADLRELVRVENVPLHYYHVSWSSDGTSIAFAARRLLTEPRRDAPTEGTYVMSSTGADAHRIADVWSASAWAPEGEELAFTRGDLSADGDLYVVKPTGTDGRTLAAATHKSPYDTYLPSWSADGSKILFDRDGELIVVNADGSGERGLGRGSDPAWSPAPDEPADERIVFARPASDGFEIALADADGRNLQPLIGQPEAGAAYAPTWSPDGTRIAWAADEGVFVANSDGADARLLVEGRHSYAWSPDGSRLVIGDVYPWQEGTFGIVDASDGRVMRDLVFEVRHRHTWPPVVAAYAPAWSPDGARIAFVSGGQLTNSATLRVVASDGTDIVRLGGEVTVQFHRYALAWSPDGESLAFTAGEGTDLITFGSDGSWERRHLIDAWAAVSWSPDGSEIAYVRPNDGGGNGVSGAPLQARGSGLYVMRADGTGERLLSARADAPQRSALGQVTRPRWSPDGSQVAFVRDGEIFIIGADGIGERSVARGLDPAWRPTVD